VIYDFACPCGCTEERNVRVADRDRQRCACGQPMRRAPHFSQVKFIIPRYMRAGGDDMNLVMPDDEEGRTEYMQDAYRQHGRWRNDLVPSTEKPKVMFNDAPR
jgi:hypothetical protein